MSLTGALFLIAFVAGSLLAFLRHPIFGLATYVAVFYANPPTRWWAHGFVEEFRWSLAAAAVALAAALLSKRIRVPPPSARLRGPLIGLMAFVTWLWIQSFWAIDVEQHGYFMSLCAKFLPAMFLIIRCIDSEANLKIFFWSHVLGCFYMGWIAFTSYAGGRFEDFGVPGLSEANAAALQMLTGIFAASSLFLAGGGYTKAALVAIIPFILNGIVTTVSRSAFLAILIGGIAFVASTPLPYRRLVSRLSILAAVLFVLLAGPTYWARIDSIKYRGQEVEGVDTGASRLAIIRAQMQMVKDHPLGCGHQCTGALSPQYVEERYLSRITGQRSSHNTFMSMWVDHGPLGAVLYVLLIIWAFRNMREVLKRLRGERTFLSAAAVAVAAALVAILVSDQFVPNTRLETRIWFIGLVLVLRRLVEDFEHDKMHGPTAAIGNVPSRR